MMDKKQKYVTLDELCAQGHEDIDQWLDRVNAIYVELPAQPPGTLYWTPCSKCGKNHLCGEICEAQHAKDGGYDEFQF